MHAMKVKSVLLITAYVEFFSRAENEAGIENVYMSESSQQKHIYLVLYAIYILVSATATQKAPTM